MQIDIPSALAGMLLGAAVVVILIFVDWWLVFAIALFAAAAVGGIAVLRTRASNIAASQRESESV